MQHMQIPSDGLAQPLRDHVHLISGYRYPINASLSLDQAFRYLLEAPQIVKQHASMSWTYVQAPQDGMIWLEWIAQDSRGDSGFPSDGYVWADPEQGYRQEFNGYTIEMMVHRVGFRPNHDPMATHARTRYHLIAKNPSINAANPDGSLWIVHYHQTEPGRMLPSQQIPLNPQVTQIMNHRRYLESQGKLERKDFMLHDRMSWPQVNIPTGGYMLQPGFYGAQPSMPNRQPSNAFPSGPPNKKMKMQHGVGASDAAHDTSIEDEENTALGDFFDHLTPRDISLARYTQHHRWMEEVFSSPYASSQIVPADLGLGLMGELKGLTDGILEMPSMDFAERQSEKAARVKEPQPFTSLGHDQLEEFNKRVSKHLEEGQAEIERMKAEHAAKMAEWKKTKTLMQAEKRLRHATWEGHEVAMPGYRLDDPAGDGSSKEGASKETVEEVVRDVEAQLGVKVSSHDEAHMIAAGGLEKDEEQPRHQATQDPNTEQQQQQTQAQPQGQSGASNDSRDAFAVQHQQDRLSTHVQTQQPTATTPAALSQINNQPELQQAQSQPPLALDQQYMQPEPTNDISSMSMDDTTMMEGMDIDINDSNIDFDDTELNTGMDEATGTAENSLQLAVQDGQGSAPAIPPTVSQPANASTILEGGLDTPQQRPDQQQQLPATESATLPLESSAAEGTLAPTKVGAGQEDDGMFNDSTFDDFTNMDDTGAGDGLIDFEGGGMGMDDSAFGEALHGMEQSDGGEGAGQGAYDVLSPAP